MSEIKSETINILLAIPQESLCNGIKAVISPVNGMQIVGELDDFENLVDSVKTHLPEILIISAIEKNLFVFDVLKTIKISYPEVSVVIMFENHEDELIYTALGLGISACVPTKVNPDELITCVRKVWHGENPIFDTLTRPGIARLIFNNMESDLNSNITDSADVRKTLSDQERGILRLVADGYTLDQIIADENRDEYEIIQHLTTIYGKLIFNNFCEYSAQPPDQSNTQGQSIDVNSAKDNVNTQEVDIYSENITPAWEGFESLKRELQETLDKLTPVNDSHVKFTEEEHEEVSDTGKEVILKTTDTDENISEILTEPHFRIVDEFEITDQEHSSKSEEFSEDMQSTDEDKVQNSENNTVRFEVNKTDESGELPQETLAATKEAEVKENEVSVKQKSRWFKFSLKRDKKVNITNNKSTKNNDGLKKTVDSEKPEFTPEQEPAPGNDKKKISKSNKGDSKYKTPTGYTSSQEEIVSSVKGVGVPVFVKTPVDGKQLEKLESIIKKIDSINIILHKGTAQEHVLVIAGQDPANLIKILGDIPLVESTSDDKGIINIKLYSLTSMDNSL